MIIALNPRVNTPLRSISRAPLEAIAAAFLMGMIFSTPQADAYSGGPLRVEFMGFEESSQRVYYVQRPLDETDQCPEVFFFDLALKNKWVAVRDSAYDRHSSNHDTDSDSLAVTEREVLKLKSRLPQLQRGSGTRLEVHVVSDSVGVEPLYGFSRIRQTVVIGAPGNSRTIELESFCNPSIRVDGVYMIPGRAERIVVVTHAGRNYGCEEVEVPVLISAP